MTAVNSDHTVPRANLDPARSATVHPSSLETNAAGESAIPPRSDNNLALPRSPLIGRDHNLATLQQLLLQEHIGLLTLTGPGGIGKTRLALQVAANVLDHFVDGVYFISLASISDPELVSATIAQTLGVRESAERPLQESLQEYLRNRQAGLIALRFYQQVAPVWLKHTVSPILLNSNA